MGRPVVHFEIMGSDAEKLQRYYRDLFEWETGDSPPGYGLVPREGNTAADGTGIGGGIGALEAGTPGYVTFYVAVPDVEAALVRAVELGGTRTYGPEEVMAGVVVGMFTDPEGHLVGVVEAEG